MESLIEGQWETLANTALQMALRGDSAMLKACMDRLAPCAEDTPSRYPTFLQWPASRTFPEPERRYWLPSLPGT
jgi:hypothetical protein